MLGITPAVASCGGGVNVCGALTYNRSGLHNTFYLKLCVVIERHEY